MKNRLRTRRSRRQPERWMAARLDCGVRKEADMKRCAMMMLSLLVLWGLHGCVQSVAPVARFTATPPFAYPPLRVTFDASASSSPNGAIVGYAWAFGDGSSGEGAVVEHTYTEKGVYEVMLVVTDSAGKTGAQAQAVEALNRVPVASFTVDKYWVG
ncbi:MAG TPA: PKD domain-containing protein, partial [Candidatus Acetothermia bacterium]|nr:PKD domain-containing protein [Candidatus Acetothermia bacterium]